MRWAPPQLAGVEDWEKRIPERIADDRIVMPRTFRHAVACALALEEADPRGNTGDTLRRHYLEHLPRAAIASPLDSALLSRKVDWARLPRITGALGRFDGSDRFLRKSDSIATLYAHSHYGRYAPLLHGTPAVLRRLQREIDAGADPEDTLDRHLASPIAHEFAHGRRDRDALLPPLLDECLAGHFATQMLLAFAFPDSTGTLSVYATPWFSQIGEQLERAFGSDGVVAAHTGRRRWEDVLPDGLARVLADIGWEDYARDRPPHLLPVKRRPLTWVKLFWSWRSGQRPTSLGAADAIAWKDLDVGGIVPEDREILRRGLLSMCLRASVERGAYTVRLEAAREVTLDAEGCCLRASVGDGIDPMPMTYAVSPALSRALGPRTFESIAPGDVAAIAASLCDGVC